MGKERRRNLKGEYFYVMVQGVVKDCIFATDHFKEYFLASMQKIQEKISIKIFAFCIMSNHGYILLKAENINALSLFMNSVNSRYARYYNKMSKRVGYVFRGRFKCEVVNSENQLLNYLACIQNSPLKAGIVENAEEYKYSSYSNYLEQKGIIDFNEAAKHYDVNVANIKAIMKERSMSVCMEHKECDDASEVLQEILNEYKVESKDILKKDKILLRKVSRELIKRSGLSLRKVANVVNVGRETLRKNMSIPPSS
jgi:REP element-mobilizing transposase RayT